MHFTSIEAGRETFRYLIQELDKLSLAYMQIVRYNGWGRPEGTPAVDEEDVIETYGQYVKNSNFITNAGFNGETAEKVLNEGIVKAVAFGQAFIANPDYFRREQEDLSKTRPTSR